MSNFTGEQYRSILMSIKDDNFLSGNFRAYKFTKQEDFDEIMAALLEANLIEYKNPPVKDKMGKIEFYDNEYKLTRLGYSEL